MLSNRPFKTFLTHFSTIEMKLYERMDISYVSRSLVIHLAVTGSITAIVYESLNIIVDQATSVSIRKPRTEVTDLSFAGPDEEITISTATNLESL